jgi:hypothetical protein
VQEAIERTARDNTAVFLAATPGLHADRLRLNLDVANASLPSAEPGPEASAEPGAEASAEPGPEASAEPGPEASVRNDYERGLGTCGVAVVD